MRIAILLLVLAAPAHAAGAPGLYDRLCDRVAASFDSARGGFVDRGVPDEPAVTLALLRARESASETWRTRALTTVTWMEDLRDEVGGGYFHHADAADPSQPFFEKRTDSNARRLETLLLAWRVTHDDVHRDEARTVADFLDRVLAIPTGGFTSRQSADWRLIPDVNGIATRAWLEWAAATGVQRHRDFAFRSLDRVWDGAWSEQGGLVRAPDETVPRLNDQVEMGRAFVLAAHIGSRAEDLRRARALGDLLLERFEDPAKGGFRTRSQLKKDGRVARAGVDFAENAGAVRFLFELAGLTRDERYRHAAERAVMRFERKLDRSREASADWALALRASLHHELTPAPSWEPLAEDVPPPPRTRRFGKVRKIGK